MNMIFTNAKLIFIVKCPNEVYNAGGDNMEHNLRKVRENLGLTQVEFSKFLNIPVKSIRNWEQNIRKPSNYIIELIIDVALKKNNELSMIKNEDRILSFSTIKEKVIEVVSLYEIDRVYLYGSYAKGAATKNSDVDLFMISEIDDLSYFGLIEDLRTKLNKKIDLLSNKTIIENSQIHNEIKKTGILIYEK